MILKHVLNNHKFKEEVKAMLQENTKELLAYMISKEGQVDLTYSEMKQYLSDLSDALESGSDFEFEFEGVKHRIIDDFVIYDLAVEYTEDMLKDCYYEVYKQIEEMPSCLCVSVDWEQSAKNVVDIDGYRACFNPYDHSEDEIGPYHIFRLGA